MEDDCAKLEKMKLDALSMLHAKEYARCCNLLGQAPEYKELYEEGMALLEQDDIDELREKHKVFVRTLAREIPNQRYRAFLDRIRENKVDISSLYANTMQKTSLLFKFFPEDFAPGKPRDLRFRKPRAIGIIFRGVADYAKRRMKEQRQIIKLERRA
jgi:hypothetical protein